MKARGRWDGMLLIARLNWPFYAVAAGVVVLALVGVVGFAAPVVRSGCALLVAGAGYFLLGSLGVSHLVYDRSNLYRWRWLDRALGGVARGRTAYCHAGYAEAVEELRVASVAGEWVVLDHYEEGRMTESSIKRARRICPVARDTVVAPFNAWPLAAGSLDVVFGILAIHELRSHGERVEWFAEARRCLKPGGRVVIAEHTRDLSNFLAFGPGFLHFHSCGSWRRSWQAAGFQRVDEFRVTPWVRIFVLA